MADTVLLVDDDPNLLAGMRRALRGEPYEILTASSASEALDTLRGRPVDVIIADEAMPGMTGTSLLMRVRVHYPEVVRMMLTGKATLDIAIEAINSGGISNLFTKPCNTIEVAFAIRHALIQRELLIAAKRLLQEARRKGAIMERMRNLHPELTSVQVDRDGAIVIEDVPADYDALLREIRNELGESR